MEELRKVILSNDLETYQQDSKNKLLRHAMVDNDVSRVVLSQDDIKNVDFNFDININLLSFIFF